MQITRQARYEKAYYININILQDIAQVFLNAEKFTTCQLTLHN